jgi:HAD superfamily hydrolase (TIGR01484 family)
MGGHEDFWINDRNNKSLKRHSLLYGGTDDLSDVKLAGEHIDEVKANMTTACFEEATDMWAAKSELPESWEIAAYDDPKDIRMDIHLEGFTKGTACEFVFNHLNIDKKDSFAFGDGENDIEMLKLVGHGIAMGNAAEHIKEIADEVTETVLNDGIAKSFKKHFGI